MPNYRLLVEVLNAGFLVVTVHLLDSVSLSFEDLLASILFVRLWFVALGGCQAHYFVLWDLVGFDFVCFGSLLGRGGGDF